MLPKGHMTRDAQLVRNRIPTMIILNSIPQKAAKLGTRFQLVTLVRKKEDKTNTTKRTKKTIIGGPMKQLFEGTNITENRERKTIDGIDSSKGSFPP